MTKSFQISKKLTMPRDCVTWVNTFVAKRGAGKTYAAAVLAEEMLKNKVPIVVIDGMGIFWGLRVGKNGQGDGLPIVVFGGEHQDIPLAPLKAKQIAHAVVETNISAVLDLSGFSKAQARSIVGDFLDELYKINRVERHVFIEEADLWAPQRVIGPEQAHCLGAVDNFVRRGGNHNLGCSLITQRSAVLNKDLLTQADCLIILRTLAPQDKKAIQAWVEEQTDEDKRKLKEWYDSLKSLDNGEAWVWHPENPKIFKKVQFRQRETFHATRMFLLSSKAQSIKLLDVSEFIKKFKDKFEPKEAEKELHDKTEMMQEIRQLRNELRQKTHQIAPLYSVTKLEIEKKNAYEKGYSKAAQQGNLKIQELMQIVKQYDAIFQKAEQTFKQISERRPHIEKLMVKLPIIPVKSSFVPTVFSNPTIPKTKSTEPKVSLITETLGDKTFGRCERAILKFLAMRQGKYLSMAQIGGLTGYSNKSGGFNNALSKLKSSDLIKRNGSQISLNEAMLNTVIEILGDEYNAPEQASLEQWLQKLSLCPRKIYEILLDNPDTEFTRDELGEQTGYSSASGGFSNAISQLCSLGLAVKTETGLKLNPELLEV